MNASVFYIQVPCCPLRYCNYRCVSRVWSTVYRCGTVAFGVLIFHLVSALTCSVVTVHPTSAKHFLNSSSFVGFVQPFDKLSLGWKRSTFINYFTRLYVTVMKVRVGIRSDFTHSNMSVVGCFPLIWTCATSYSLGNS